MVSAAVVPVETEVASSPGVHVTVAWSESQRSRTGDDRHDEESVPGSSPCWAADDAVTPWKEYEALPPAPIGT